MLAEIQGRSPYLKHLKLSCRIPKPAMSLPSCSARFTACRSAKLILYSETHSWLNSSLELRAKTVLRRQCARDPAKASRTGPAI